MSGTPVYEHTFSTHGAMDELLIPMADLARWPRPGVSLKEWGQCWTDLLDQVLGVLRQARWETDKPVGHSPRWVATSTLPEQRICILFVDDRGILGGNIHNAWDKKRLGTIEPNLWLHPQTLQIMGPRLGRDLARPDAPWVRMSAVEEVVRSIMQVVETQRDPE